ncbi:MAG: hypothetical protein KJZ87_28110, partial [Thermoguttaceae bacterium]|nr:hypothetical protein [Thermoguttaceae bacterium]
MATDRDVAVILAHLDRFSSRDLLQREFYRRGWPEKYAFGAPPHFTENQHPRSPKPLGITIGGEYYPPGRWIPKHKLDQATPAERAMLGLPPGKPQAATEDRPKERQPRQAKKDTEPPRRPSPQQPRQPAPAD